MLKISIKLIFLNFLKNEVFEASIVWFILTEFFQTTGAQSIVNKDNLSKVYFSCYMRYCYFDTRLIMQVLKCL